MTFQTIEKTAAGRAPCKGCAVAVNSAGKKLMFYMRLSSDVMERLGVGVGDRLVVEQGDSEHFGQLRLKKGDLSGFKIGRNGNQRAGRINLVALVTKRNHPITAAPHKFSNGYLYIELPDWARTKKATVA